MQEAAERKRAQGEEASSFVFGPERVRFGWHRCYSMHGPDNWIGGLTSSGHCSEVVSRIEKSPTAKLTCSRSQYPAQGALSALRGGARLRTCCAAECGIEIARCIARGKGKVLVRTRGAAAGCADWPISRWLRRPRVCADSQSDRRAGEALPTRTG